ncbi:hypothetical protein FK219_009945 [Chryseoglobus sp. KN1116]|uniref:ABC transmembrane type-2 domain-containing protein n=1 Tax=Microcella pacifica TaxID=2591847 RepID=A0A9E5ML61_9MICO|nr:hypothetical protein [Microcella pacifica]
MVVFLLLAVLMVRRRRGCGHPQQ